MEPLTHFQEDVLTDLLQSIHMRRTLYCRASMSAPWGFRVSQREVASFHIVPGGACWLTIEGFDRPVQVSEGDLVILPHDRQPDEPWSVESLASHVGLSRSAFSSRFRQLIGEPPMRYMTR